MKSHKKQGPSFVPNVLTKIELGKRIDEVELRKAKAEYERLVITSEVNQVKSGQERQKIARTANIVPKARFNMKIDESELTAWYEAFQPLNFKSVSEMVRYAVNSMIAGSLDHTKKPKIDY